MSNTQLTGVIAHIISHADGVINDKAAFTQRLSSMGAAVASRFTGLVTHVIFRRKPQATKEERLAEDEALWELYTRIDKAAQLRPSTARAYILEPFWIEACFNGQMRASEKPYLLPRPDPLLHLPRSKTPGSSAGKKRRRHVQQPKPVQKYDLDVAAFEFSSTQKMHDEEPLPSAAMLGREGACEQALQLEVCPGSAGSVPATHSVQVVDLTAARPSSAPPHLESSSQAVVEPEHKVGDETKTEMLTAACSLRSASQTRDGAPVGEHERPHAQLGSPATAGYEQGARGDGSPLTGLQHQQLHGTKVFVTESSGLGLHAGLARLHAAQAQPQPAARLALEAVRGHQTPAAARRPVSSAWATAGSDKFALQQQQQGRHAEQGTPRTRERPCQRLPLLSGLSKAQSALCTPRQLNSASPLQQSSLPTLKQTSTITEVQTTPTLAGKRSTAQRHGHQTAWTMLKERQLAVLDGTARIGSHDGLTRADSAARVRTPIPLSIPKLRATPAARMGQTPLAFPALSPGAAQPDRTPQTWADRHATHAGRLSKTSTRQETGKQEEAADRPACTPLLRSSDAAYPFLGGVPTSMKGVAAHDGHGFGSPLLIEDTPQPSHPHGTRQPSAAPEALPTSAVVVSSLCPQHTPHAAASQGAQASALQHPADLARSGWAESAQRTGVDVQLSDLLEGGSAEEPLNHAATADRSLLGRPGDECGIPPQPAGAAGRPAATRGRRRPKRAAAQQENAGAAHQQAGSRAAQRQPLLSKDTVVLGNASGSEKRGRARKRQRSEQEATTKPGAGVMEGAEGAGLDGERFEARERSRPLTSMRGIEVAQEDRSEDGPRSSPGCLAASQDIASAKRAAVLGLSSVSDADAKAAAKAIKRLGGMQPCAAGAEAHVTHLVMGSPRRTLKVLLAIAAGAWLLTPEWVAASAAAGMWLDERSFQPETSFALAAARARGHAARGGQPLLAGTAVHIMKSASAKPSGDGAVALTLMALAHGAKVTGLRQCDVCILCKEGMPPDRTKCPVAVREAWLLDLAASFEVPEFSDAYDARQPIHGRP